MPDSTGKIADCLWLICFGIAICGSIYALFSAYLAGRIERKTGPRPVTFPAVTILKPLHGAEPELAENLTSFCGQDYPAPVQVVCGIQDPKDPAGEVVRGLQESLPTVAIDLVCDATQHGQNRKISNIINMMTVARRDVIVLADSDMRVSPGYLTDIVGALQTPGVGAVTCLYRGLPSASLWSRLASMNIDQRFLPNVLVGLHLGLAKPCFGSTIALDAKTLKDIGGFEAFKDQLADDYLMGAAVRKLGLEVAMPPCVIGHTCPETRFSELWIHELRWARTIRLVDPLGYAGSVVTHPVPFALLAVGLGGATIWSVGSVVLALAARALIPLQLPKIAGALQGSLWLLPFRELRDLSRQLSAAAGLMARPQLRCRV
jgi:ceramide glucosyltransferase